MHFDVIRPHIHQLRRWSGNVTATVTLVKMKSHTGCFLNDGRMSQQGLVGWLRNSSQTSAQVPKRTDPSRADWMRVRPAVREIALSSGKPLSQWCSELQSLREGCWRRLIPVLCGPSRSVVQLLLPTSYLIRRVLLCPKSLDDVSQQNTGYGLNV